MWHQHVAEHIIDTMQNGRALQVACPECGGVIYEREDKWRCAKCRFSLSVFHNGEKRSIAEAEREVANIANEIGRVGRRQRGRTPVESTSAGVGDVASRKKAIGRTRPTSEDCKPMLEAATKDLFRKNAFRITGLPVDSTTREISRHSDKLKIMAELGHEESVHTAAFAIKPPPSLDEIREAIQRLNDPEKRLIDEFFWFWPEEFDNNQSDPATQALAKGDSKTAIEIWAARENGAASSATAKHNLALIHHVRALDSEIDALENADEVEPRQNIATDWREAFSRWENLATNEHFWEQVVARIRQMNEPNLPTGFARRMRATLPEALDKINAELAVAFAESGKTGLARLHIQFMRETHQGLDNVEKTAELVLTPAKNRLKEQTRRAKERADKNPREGAKAARELIEQSRPTLSLFGLFFATESEVRAEICEEVARVCNQLVIAYDKATSNDNKTCLEILKEVIPLAHQFELKQLIAKNICWFTLPLIQDSKESPSSRLNQFKSLSSSYLDSIEANDPNKDSQLFDFAANVLRGISLEAWNTFQDKSTATSANKLAIKYACTSELKNRLLEDRATLVRVAVEPPTTRATPPSIPSQQKKTANLAGIACLVVVAIFIVFGIFGSSNFTNDTPRSNSYTSPAYTPPAPNAVVPLEAKPNPIVEFDAPIVEFDEPTSPPAEPFPPLNLQGLNFNGPKSFAIINGATVAIGEPIGNSGTHEQVRVVAIDRDRVTVELNGRTKVLALGVNAPTYTPRPASASGNSGGNGGNVYHVPSSVSAALKIEKAEIESERATLEAFEAQIERLGREIERDRTYLNRSSQYAVDAFNAKVDRYNALNQRAKIANAAFNEKVDNYNAKLQRYGR